MSLPDTHLRRETRRPNLFPDPRESAVALEDRWQTSGAFISSARGISSLRHQS
jgi:hypothetical protein